MGMTLLAALAVLVVLATNVLKSVGWSASVKHLVATGVAVLAAVLGLWSNGTLDSVTDVVEGALMIHGASQVVYNFILRGTALNDKMESVGVK
jgi:hypothetical protein